MDGANTHRLTYEFQDLRPQKKPTKASAERVSASNTEFRASSRRAARKIS